MDSDKFEEIFNSECSCWIFVSKLHSILFGINEKSYILNEATFWVS